MLAGWAGVAGLAEGQGERAREGATTGKGCIDMYIYIYIYIYIYTRRSAALRGRIRRRRGRRRRRRRRRRRGKTGLPDCLRWAGGPHALGKVVLKRWLGVGWIWGGLGGRGHSCPAHVWRTSMPSTKGAQTRTGAFRPSARPPAHVPLLSN